MRELLMDTGVAGRSYSIVEQGKVDEFITATPQERRTFMEEAAGVMRFKTRRIAAERKLEQTSQNMLRVQDVMAELQRQEGTLREQTEKAKAYLALQEQVTVLSSELARLRYAKSAAQCRQLENTLLGAQAELLTAEQELAKHATDLETLTLEQEQRQKDLQGRRSASHLKEQEISKGETRRLVLTQQQSNVRQWLTQLGTSEAELAAKQQATESQRAGLAAEEAEARQLAATVEQAIAGDKAATDEALAAAQAKAGEVRTAQEKLIEAATKLTGLRNQATFLEERIADDEQRAAGLGAQIASLKEALAAAETALAAGKVREQEMQAALTTAETESQALVQQTGEHSQTQQAHRKTLGAAERETMEARSRLKTLRDIQAAYQGYGEGVRAFMNKVAGDVARRAELGIVGPIAELIQPPAALVEWAGDYLAPYLEVIVVKEAANLVRIEALMGEAKLGGLRFVALDALPSRQALSGDPTLASEVPFADGLEALRQSLFGAVRLLPAGSAFDATLASGESLSRDGRFSIDGRGVVTVGRSGSPALGILQRKAEIEALEIRVAELERNVAELQQADQALVARGQELEASRQALGQKRSELSVAVKQAQTESAGSEREANRVRTSLNQQEADGARLAENLERFRQQRAEYLTQAETLAGEEVQLKSGFPQIQAEADGLRVQADQAANRLTQRRMEYDRLKSRLEQHVQRLADLNAASAELSKKLDETRQQVEDYRTQATATDEELATLVPALSELQTELDQLRQAVRVAAQAFDEQDQRGRELEGHIKTCRQAVEVRQTRVHDIDKKLAQERMRLEQWQAQLPPGVVPPEGAEGVVADFVPTEGRDERTLDQALSRAQGELKEMGAVNLAAPEEYEQLTQRLGFLTTEKADLDRAIQDLETSIRKMNQESRRRFKETFDKVNEQFQALFPKVFGGGEARLVLTDSDDPLLAGVDIVAQPPGKKLQSLNLLSGGEKALTAISLIFSFFLIKPSPFCLLDEVDAPLDDVNVGRFNRLIESMTAHSQFIIITHNKRTMEIGDLLYGVTMEEAGVSKIVSVTLSGNAA
ncbi:MAG TPA: chromosome segregation protein SMC [Terriglobia bacterium]|nr:chromosome segregation protein SMC [Terriglobia bacterium]